MALSSILYTLLVLFLALLFGILGIISSGNFTLNKLKNDIITKLDNGIIDNSTVNYVCRKATILHTEECTQTDGEKYCSGAGYTKSGSKGTTMIAYGQIGANGLLASGDAFDCGVNSDGVYDPVTERFYYVSDYYNTATKEFESDKATLIYYNNTTSGSPDNTSAGLIAYYANANENWHGPVTAVTNLPTREQWTNPNLTTGTRDIIAETGANATSGGTLPIGFDYSNYAARLLTAQEINSACGITVGSYQTGELDKCNYLMENTKYSSDLMGTYGYWIETPRANYPNIVWGVVGHYRDVSYGSNVYDASNRGARPAITILKSNIAY